jgi:NTE family protein
MSPRFRHGSGPGGAFLLSAALTASIFFSGSICAADSPGRPKIGLALSGGGARGAAHIGVLRVLEEMRVPVDYVAGTSMGSIVGGFYAAGMSPDKLEEVLLGIDWELAFSDKPRREDLSFRRKQDGDDYPISLQLGWRDRKLRMPKGLIQGQNLNAILTSLTLPVALVDDFDDFSIPYRAVAADIVTGEKVVIGSGNLATAMRASMSIPGIFAPVEIDGMMLVDGGIASNLPVETVRAMGADIVIAVDISTPLMKREQLQSALSITAQLSGFLTRRNTVYEISTLGEKDVLIVPLLGDIGSGSFAKAGEAVPIGETAAREAAPGLTALSLPEQEYAAHLSSRGRPDPAPPKIDFVKVETDGKLADDVISSLLQAEVGTPLDFAEHKKDIDQIYGLGIFERVDSALVREGDETGLLVKTVRKSWGPNYLNFGLEMESDLDGGSSFNFRTRLTVTEINRWGAEWRSDVQVGERPFFITEFFQPLGGAFSGYFIAPRLEFEEFTAFLFDDDTAIANFRVDRKLVALDVGKQFGSWGEARLGVFYETADAELKIGGFPPVSDLDTLDIRSSIFDDSDFDSGGLSLAFAYDTLNSLNFPRRGTKATAALLVSLEELGADESFKSFGGRISHARTIGFNTFTFKGVYGSVFDEEAPIQDTFALGGLFNLSGLGRDQLRGQQAILGVLGYYRQIAGKSAAPPKVPVYAGFSLEAGNTWQEKKDIKLDTFIPAGSVFLGLDTFLGPVYLAYGYAEGGRDAFYFFLGRGF